MWTEIAAVLVLLVANVLCYAAHHKSVFHTRFKLPKLAFVTNAWWPHLTDPKASTNYWQFDSLRASDLVTGFFISDTCILVLRCSEVLFFAVTLLVEGLTGDGFGDPDRWLTFFTNWTFVLFGFYALLGTLLTAQHVQGKITQAAGQDEETWGRCYGSKPVTNWSLLAVTYCLVAEVNATATLFLSIFYWAIIFRGNPAPDNILKHGVNNAMILADICLTRVPFHSYHFQVVLWYGSVYLVFMWIYHGASTYWVYEVLDWSKPIAALFYLLLPLLLLICAFVWFGIAAGREAALVAPAPLLHGPHPFIAKPSLAQPQLAQSSACRKRQCITRAVAATEEKPSTKSEKSMTTSQIGLAGLAVMGQNLALNIAEKGFRISVYNRTYEKTEACEKRAKKEGLDNNLKGYENFKDFVASLEKPRRVIILVKAGAPVDATIKGLMEHMEKGDIIIDGGNEWYENTEKRKAMVAEKGLLYMGMGVSGGEEGARNGPSMMPGGSPEAYKFIEPIVTKVAAQVDDGPCVTYIGDGGAGNFVKMVHNGIEYGDMQLIAEGYDILRTCGGLTAEELCIAFTEWNKTELSSFLMEITALIFGKKDDQKDDGWLLDVIKDQTGMKGTGKWTVQQAAELSVAAPTMAAALDGRFMSGLKEERVAASKLYTDTFQLPDPGPIKGVDKQQLMLDVKDALYAAKITSYAQGMNIIRAKSEAMGWNIDLGGLARIWKGGCIIRAGFLDDIKKAYDRDANLKNLLVDEFFAKKLAEKQKAWRQVATMAISNGVATPGLVSSLAYFDTYRREKLTANLIQAQRDFFGSHTYERLDKPGWFHTVWSDQNSADSITTSGYKN
ncbi:hypothetical protein WJX73_009871 [Symbiochloris irregularis]|uniref:6-phosphogluconate dehydrogenase, decarboxylating n=1 Tax=Symbiochloris irregularis TaxID=706552 RepID=A0AAW1PIZ2_9CHLO